MEQEQKVYKLELDEPRLKIYIAGLDSGIKIIAQQLLQGNSCAVLKQLLPSLIDLDRELSFLDKTIDETKTLEVKNASV